MLPARELPAFRSTIQDGGGADEERFGHRHLREIRLRHLFLICVIVFREICALETRKAVFSSEPQCT